MSAFASSRSSTDKEDGGDNRAKRSHIDDGSSVPSGKSRKSPSVVLGEY